MAPQTLTTERALTIARIAVRAAHRWEPFWGEPRRMVEHIRLLEERGSLADVCLAAQARVHLIRRHPALFGGAALPGRTPRRPTHATGMPRRAPRFRDRLRDLSPFECFALGFAASAALDFLLSII